AAHQYHADRTTTTWNMTDMTNDATLGQSDDNPLLDQRDLPRFAGFDPAQVTPAIDRLLVQAEAALAQATDPSTPATWNEFVLPLQEATERLGRAWGMVRHLNS